MIERNLPILMVGQKRDDLKKNSPGGSVKFFDEVTPELKNAIVSKFEAVGKFYSEIFEKNELLPAVGKLKVKEEAIAKSHKPTDLCKVCPIIGSKDLDEMYIKVTKQGIKKTISLIKNPPSERFKANLTAVSDIQPFTSLDKISKRLATFESSEDFDSIKHRVKIHVFNFDDSYDNEIINEYVVEQLKEKIKKPFQTHQFGQTIKFMTIEVSSYDDVKNIASIHGIQTVDILEEYSQPVNQSLETTLPAVFDDLAVENDVLIGVIDGGISDSNPFVKPFIESREEHIPEIYQNHSHGTFIASTILYGNHLNGLGTSPQKGFKLIDIVAIPNGDVRRGPVDTIDDCELMEIITETMEKYAPTVKIWNLSLGIPDLVCDYKMSTLGIFLDQIQDIYKVQFFVSAGNLPSSSPRKWPPQPSVEGLDRIISPADSIRALTTGSIALNENSSSIVRKNEPSPFSRRGPGANYTTKPEMVDYGGNLAYEPRFQIGLGVKGLDPKGKIVEGLGTSYANPRVLQKFATVYSDMVERDLLLTKALLIHSSRMWSRHLYDRNPENIHYYGFGMPALQSNQVLRCSSNEATLVFKYSIAKSSHIEMIDFPYPPSLIRDGKCFGEIAMTLVMDPIIDDRYAGEYCRLNIEASFGIYGFNPKEGKREFKGMVPMEAAWNDKFEKARVDFGFKWNPIKSYFRKIKNGIDYREGWKIRIDMSPRSGLEARAQEFILIITIKDPDGKDIYTELVNGLRSRGHSLNNLQTRHVLRQRQ